MTDTLDETDVEDGGDIQDEPEQIDGDADDADEEADADAGPDEPDEPAARKDGIQSEKQMEKAFKRLEAEQTRHKNRIAEIIGDDADELLPCPLCAPLMPGFRWPLEPEEPVKEAVLAVLGMGGEPDYERATDARICDGCKGLGNVLTGSLVPAHRTKLCPRCGGCGWVNVGGPTQFSERVPGETAPSPVPSVSAEPLPDEDMWHRPRGHPDYGRMPMYCQ